MPLQLVNTFTIRLPKKPKTPTPTFHIVVAVLPDKQIYHRYFPLPEFRFSKRLLQLCCKQAQETLQGWPSRQWPI